jgi:hypothetical protein
VISDRVLIFSGLSTGVGLGEYGANITGRVVGVTLLTGIISVSMGTLSATTRALRLSIFTGIIVWMRVGGWGLALVLPVVDVQ